MNFLRNMFIELWSVLNDMSFYLIMGFVVAGFLHIMIRPETVVRHLGGRGFLQVFKAVVFGIPLPLCSCGTLPVAMTLRKSGASKGATSAFLTSTPQTGVDSIFLTFSLLGPVFALIRPLAAFLSGMATGLLVDRFDGDKDPVPSVAEECQECKAAEDKDNVIARAFKYAFITLPQDIAVPLTAGLLVSALISTLLPGNILAEILGIGIFSMIVMMLVGMPMYVCASAAVPVAAAMMAKGITPGAALVFLMTAPATNAAVITVIRKTFGWRSTLIYLASIGLTSLACGLIVDAFFVTVVTKGVHACHDAVPGLLANISVFVLAGILILSVSYSKLMRFFSSKRENSKCCH